ncbi:bifunctional methionine sulfoxide reductase B/A protein [Algivirga pacifica]|uniref:Peptide methionine sulfoxide reductase MsrA n=1 Tax=Algivirga pacifica TaxID=1162670 RepID=A0ABP9DJG5_9BACT
MKYTSLFTVLLVLMTACGWSQNDKQNTKMNKLTDFEEYVILNKGTERPNTGLYNNHFEGGTYVCRKCEAPLYNSEDKFESHCGWPSFDDEINGAVKRKTDADGRRTEILCANCDAHLGHVFIGERLTAKNTRHCVNSVSMKFVPSLNGKEQKVVLAGGDFKGLQFFLAQIPGIVRTKAGFVGTGSEKPTYESVQSGEGNYVMAVEILYAPEKIAFDDVIRIFMEVHDPTTPNQQGTDMGSQYRSVIYYNTEAQKETAQEVIQELEAKDVKVTTTLEELPSFVEAAENYQDYYFRSAEGPKNHSYTKRF